MIGEFGKISEKDLTVKDLGRTEALGGLPEFYGRGYLSLSVEVNSKSQNYNVSGSAIV